MTPPPPSRVNHLSHPCIYGDFVSSYAEKKSRFMKWLRKLFKSASGRGGASRYPQYLGDEDMVWHAPVRSADDHSRGEEEKEDLDRAIAISLAEDLRRQNGCRWRTDNDGNIPRELDDSLNAPSYPPRPPTQYYPRRGYRVCGGCNREIGHGNYLGCMETFFHPECFRCRACGYPITEYEFSLSGRDPYHQSCFKELTHPKCEVCHQFSWNTTYISLGDGRSLCLECMESAIMDTGDCQPLYHAIRDYYEGMNMKLDQQIPMLLVERQALNEAIVGEKNGHHHMPETRGLCLSEEQTVSSVHRRPRIGGHRLVGMRTQPQKLTRKCEVTAILVLYGLPRLLTGAILAHELMHGWLRLKGYRNLNPEVEEGICQVLSYMWLETEVMPIYGSAPSTSAASSSSTPSKKGAKSDVEKKLGEFFMHQIVNDASSAYGEGFRAANAAVNKYGLRRTLDHIKITGLFPS
ncbi:LIM zinc-binding domain-containing protein [Psidium guajava]|nr:LIM zinc-binding domain-containing protein [Psidium guajava]